MARPACKASENTMGVSMEILSPAGPTMAYHVGCILNDVLYIHGGIDKKLSKCPLSKMFRIDLAGDRIWTEVRNSESPALSHHACVTLNNRYILMIGGWDGKFRSTDVFVYDTDEQKWLFPATSGFPQGGGLSSHTATLLSNGDILICGRDGSARMQRRYGNVYVLKGSIQSGYSYAPSKLHVESRSGHTAHGINSSLFILGGRSDKTVEVHTGMKSLDEPSAFVTNLTRKLDFSAPMSKPPCGRKQHVSVFASNAIFIHGGETFDGKSRDPVGEMYLLTTKPTVQWHKLGESGVRRAGHVCCAYKDEVVVHGGEGIKGFIHSDCWVIKVT